MILNFIQGISDKTEYLFVVVLLHHVIEIIFTSKRLKDNVTAKKIVFGLRIFIVVTFNTLVVLMYLDIGSVQFDVYFIFICLMLLGVNVMLLRRAFKKE